MVLGFPLLRLSPSLGIPYPHQKGTHPKVSRLQLTVGKGGGGSSGQRARPERCCNGFLHVTTPSPGLSHCAKPTLPGTKMVDRKLLRQRASPCYVINTRERTRKEGLLSVALEMEKFCAVGRDLRSGLRRKFIWKNLVNKLTFSGFVSSLKTYTESVKCLLLSLKTNNKIQLIPWAVKNTRTVVIQGSGTGGDWCKETRLTRSQIYGWIHLNPNPCPECD